MDIQQKAREYADCKSCEDKKFCSGHKWNENACNKHQGFIAGATAILDEIEKWVIDQQHVTIPANRIINKLQELRGK